MLVFILLMIADAVIDWQLLLDARLGIVQSVLLLRLARVADLGLEVACVEISDNIGLVVFELSSQVFDTFGRVRASIAVNLAAEAGRHKQRWDLLVRLGHLGDGFEDLLCHLVLEIRNVMHRVA